MGQPLGPQGPRSRASERQTRGTETSQYPEEEKATAIPKVAASEIGPAQTRRACTTGVVGPRHGSTTPNRSGLERPAKDGDSPVDVRVRPLAASRVARDTCNPARNWGDHPQRQNPPVGPMVHESGEEREKSPPGGEEKRPETRVSK